MATGLRCPRCSADALYSYGRIKNGKQRYLCLVCNRQFVPESTLRTVMKDRPACPLCGAKMHIYRREAEQIRFRCANYPACRGYGKWKK